MIGRQILGTVTEVTGVMQRVHTDAPEAHLQNITLTGITRAAGANVGDTVRLTYLALGTYGAIWFAEAV